MNPKLKDVADAAGVSLSTASRALANNPTIAQATRDKVQQIAKELNYRPNAQAQGLRASRSNSIGVIVPTLNNPYFAAMASAIEEENSAVGLNTLVVSSAEDPERFDKSIDTLLSHQSDGIIAVPIEGNDDNLNYAAATKPLLLIDRKIGDHPAVVSDPTPGIDSALAHLAAHGHKRVGYLSGPKNTSTGAERFGAGRDAAARHGLDWVIHHGGFTHQEGFAGTQELLQQGVTAIVAGDGMMTTGALEACHRANVKLGSELALIGFDDVPFLRFQPAPVSVIDQDVDALARQAAHTLINAVLKGGTLDSTVIPSTFIPRASSDFDIHT